MAASTSSHFAEPAGLAPIAQPTSSFSAEAELELGAGFGAEAAAFSLLGQFRTTVAGGASSTPSNEGDNAFIVTVCVVVLAVAPGRVLHCA